MSRSNNTELINLSVRFYEWVGSKGCLKYFDKEKKENIFVQLPFSFLVLDRLSTIRGFSDADQSGFWSNEVRDIRREPFTVRTKKGIVATGLYSTLAHVLNQGASYCQSVYIAVKEGKDLIICNIQMSGSAIGEWIDLCKGKDIYKYVVTISDAAPAQKGQTKYFTPVFKLSSNIGSETEARAIELDRQLQEYLTAYFKRSQILQQENTVTGIVSTDNANGHDIDEINTNLSNAANAVPLASEVTEPLDDLPF